MDEMELYGLIIFPIYLISSFRTINHLEILPVFMLFYFLVLPTYLLTPFTVPFSFLLTVRASYSTNTYTVTGGKAMVANQTHFLPSLRSSTKSQNY